MELYLLGSLLGLGYYLNSNQEVKKKDLNYPKKMYRGNIYDNEQYDRVENEIFDRAKVKFDNAQNIYENNVVGQYTPDVLYHKENEKKFSKGLETFTDNEFGNSIRSDFCYIDENAQPLHSINKHTLVSPIKNEHENKTVKTDNALSKVSNNEILGWNDDGGVEMHTDLEEQFNLLEKGGSQGVKQTYEQPWHNNMVPFFGGTMKQNIDPLVNETKLSMYTGQWDYSKKQKKEIAPMFAPEKDIRNVYGDQKYLENLTTNLDRYIPSLMRNNETPTEKIFVAPGLNLGYNENPDFGFQDPVRVLPKTTNEIRAKNKPKLTYDRPVISGKSLTQEGTKRLNVNKNLPELVVYNEKGERNFGAKSVVQGETGRPTYLLGRAVRSFSRYFFGHAKDTQNQKESSRTAYTGKTSKKNYKLNRMGIATAEVKKHTNLVNDKAKITKKQLIENNNHMGYFSSIITALTSYIAPPKETIKEKTLISRKPINFSSNKKGIQTRIINDKAKNTLKEITENNKRNGNITISKKLGKVYNTSEKAKSTLREITEVNTKNGNLKSSRKVGKVFDPSEKAKTTLRENTEINTKNGYLKPSRKVGKVFDPKEKAKTTLRENTEINTKNGNLNTSRKVGKVFDPTEKAKTTIRETTEINNHEANITTSRKVGKVYDPTEKAKTTIRETTEINNHEANITTSRKVGKAYDPAEKAKTTVRETTEKNEKNGNIKITKNVPKVYDPDDKPEYTLKDIVKVANYKGVVGNTEKKLKIYDPDDKAKYTTRQDTLVEKYYGGKDGGLNHGAHEILEIDPKYTTRQDALVENYLGAAINDVSAQQSYKAAYNAETNELKEKIAEGRAPTQNSVKIVAGVESQCVDIKKIDSDSKNPRGMEEEGPNIGRVYQLPPTTNGERITKDKNTVINRYTDRIAPEILDAFKNNPYTQSLHSYAYA